MLVFYMVEMKINKKKNRQEIASGSVRKPSGNRQETVRKPSGNKRFLDFFNFNN
jgi:hypothetical protein